MTFAIIKTGGKQYLVKEGDKIKIEKLADKAGLAMAEGEAVDLGEALLTDDGQTTTVGMPTVSGTKVAGKVLKQGRHDKISVIHFRAKTNLRKKYGHKQPYTEVEITKIG